jgi:hypothetical protein
MHTDPMEEEGLLSVISTTAVLSSSPVVSLAHQTTSKSVDGKYASISIVLSHVAMNQDIIRTTLNTEFDFTHVIEGCSDSQFLHEAWGKRTFCVVDHANVKEWLDRALAVSRADKSATVVCLCPARTNTDYFHEIVIPFAQSIRFIKGRLKMPGHTRQSPFPSVVVVFGPSANSKRDERQPTIFARPT